MTTCYCHICNKEIEDSSGANLRLKKGTYFVHKKCKQLHDSGYDTVVKTKVKEEYYLTKNGIKIDAHWNSFSSMKEAIECFEETMANILVDSWSIVCEKKTIIDHEIFYKGQ